MLPWLAYPLLGIAFRYLLADESFAGFVERKSVLAVLWLLLLIFILFTGIYAVEISHNRPSYYHHGSRFFMDGTVHGLLAHQLSRNISQVPLITADHLDAMGWEKRHSVLRRPVAHHRQHGDRDLSA